MLVLDKARALDRMVWLSDRKVNAVPLDLLRPSPLRWTIAPGGRRALAGEVVLCPPSATEMAFYSPEAAAIVEDLRAEARDVVAPRGGGDYLHRATRQAEHRRPER